MGNRSGLSRSSGLRLMARLASLVAALLVLCLSNRVSAASNPVVPMCGERGESIAAPPIFRAYESGSVIATPCQPDRLVMGHSAPPATPERTLVEQRPERVLGFSSLCLAEVESSRVAMTGKSARLRRPGFAGSLFRPPRA
jgi:hypothetical protein